MPNCKHKKNNCLEHTNCQWIKNKGCRILKSPIRSPLNKNLLARSKSPVRIPLKQGKLREFGYSSKNTKFDRQRSLERATEEYGATSVFKKLNALMILNKNRNPSLSTKFKQDRDWVKNNLM